jgi:hypothetical protein
MSEERDIVDEALDTLDRGLDTLYDSVIRRLILAGRALAYGFVLFLLLVVLVVAFTIGFIRLLNVYAFASHPWLSDVVLGAVFLAFGLWIWRKRTIRPLKK